MTIETILERIAVANEKSAAALEKMANFAEAANLTADLLPSSGQAAAGTPAPAAKGKAKKTTTTAAEKANAAPAEVKEEPKGNAAPADDFLAEKGKKVTSEDVKALAQKFVAENGEDGRTKAQDVLEKATGVRKIKEVPEDKLAAAAAAFEKALKKGEAEEL